MPIFRSTKDILITPWEDEVFDPNWMDSDTLKLPPKKDWDYTRELKIENVNIWEVIAERGGGCGVYASWDPYAEFYMITPGWLLKSQNYGVETYYGAGAQEQVKKRMRHYGLHVPEFKVWVEPADMWLYEKPITNTLILP
jgi:hypothetical protein